MYTLKPISIYTDMYHMYQLMHSTTFGSTTNKLSMKKRNKQKTDERKKTRESKRERKTKTKEKRRGPQGQKQSKAKRSNIYRVSYLTHHVL